MPLGAEQEARLRASLGLVALAQAAACAACAWLFAPAAGELAVTAWALLVLASQSPALLLSRRASRPWRPARMHRLLRVAAALNGLLWGLAPWWIAPRAGLAAGLAAFVVACVAGGVALALAFDAVAALGFAAGALLPLVLWLSLIDAPAAHGAAVLAAGYLLFVVLAVRGAQQRFARGQAWRLRAQQELQLREHQSLRAHRLARLNALLAELGQLGAQAEDLENYLHTVCRVAVQRGGLSQAWIARASEPVEDRPQGRAASGAPAQGLENAWGGPAVSRDLTVLASFAAREGSRTLPGREQALRACDAAQPCFCGLEAPRDPARTPAGGGAGLPGASVAALPLRGDGPGRAGGSLVLVLCLDEAEALDAATADVLVNAGLAVQRALQGLEQRRRMEQLQSLYRALMREVDVLLQARSVPDMLLRTCQTLTEGTQFHAAWMARPDEAGRIEVIARAGSGADQLDALRISLHDADKSPLVIRVWNSHRNVCCNDLLGDASLAPWRGSMRRHEWRAALAAPVFRGASIWAVLVFVSPQPEAFDDATTELCQRVAELLGHGLDELDTKRRLNDLQLEESHRARHDLLTGLPNRFALNQYLPQALAAARRDGTVLAVGMLDLDDFKPVNDTWGHDVGDVLLREIGQRLRGAIRKFDVLARLGGDEFVVVIEQIDSAQVLAQLSDVLGRLHAAVEQPFELAPGCRASVGMSMGLALFPLDAQDPEGLLRQADAAMYQAKLHKGDRARWWQLAPASVARLEATGPRAVPPWQMVSPSRAS
ncbi:diguanylate cyclase domain-containing protein [Thiomonas sp. FB-6]|uniref:diguanylate cyclase domain-containing protein n=1 Tax=Thiomonas sp. FB-6 TaxID=1158291 RepID=UPI000375CEB2|nr:diguanylate cyclase [Thiomonas sp. FB-6]